MKVASPTTVVIAERATTRIAKLDSATNIKATPRALSGRWSTIRPMLALTICCVDVLTWRGKRRMDGEAWDAACQAAIFLARSPFELFQCTIMPVSL